MAAAFSLTRLQPGLEPLKTTARHVFQGRYKALPVNASDSDAHYFKELADYIHLNPVRTGLAGGKRGPLLDYPWSSPRGHYKGNGPDWLTSGRGLRASNWRTSML